ncbi:MAG: carbohydrate kinase family protein [Clostridiaceae bacterium]|jgi:sugar/nucleoside kinase (ribokinase family)|nr:carbohydrate kinase family protein [Clostridiaceae bacterium]
MKKNDVYLYGMILITNSFLLRDAYPEPDTYGEITQKYSLPGGETGTCATVLANYGCSVIMDGTYMGKNTYPQILKFYQDKSVDTSRLFFEADYDGLEDYVLIDKNTRTPFGTFAQYYSDGLKRWNRPLDEDIIASRVAGIDPWFEDQTLKVSRICKANGIPYVTIDCPYDSELHQNSSINVISNEFISTNYKDADRSSLFEKYISNTEGLVFFTLGSKDIMYGRKGQVPRHFKPYTIDVVSTLGAGDCFKAGCVYALLQNMSDEDTVRFAAATAACACSVFPLPLNPPTLEKVRALQASQR